MIWITSNRVYPFNTSLLVGRRIDNQQDDRQNEDGKQHEWDYGVVWALYAANTRSWRLQLAESLHCAQKTWQASSAQILRYIYATAQVPLQPTHSLTLIVLKFQKKEKLERKKQKSREKRMTNKRWIKQILMSWIDEDTHIDNMGWENTTEKNIR